MFRNTPIGRNIWRLPLGRRAILLIGGIVRRRERIARFAPRMRDAYALKGIEYKPLSGRWPISMPLPQDQWFAATFPDGTKMDIHLTEERGYEDIDGMEHLPLYQMFEKQVWPTVISAEGGSLYPILDCACGSGYGSNYLSEALQHPVIGVDVEEKVIEYDLKRYAADNLRLKYVCADATDLSMLSHGMIAAIISVETIEHVPDADRALAEFRRVLRPGGALFISSPDATDRPDTLISAFHIREYSRQDFERLLRRHFSSVELFTQAGYILGVCRS